MDRLTSVRVPRPRRTGWVALNFALVVLLAAAAVACGDDSSSEVSAGQESSPDSTAVGTEGILGREFQAVAWTDSGLFVYGGRDPQIDGGDPLGGAALVNAESGAVEALPEPPVPAPLATRSVAASTGADVLVFGELCESVAETEDTQLCAPGGLAGAVYSLDEGAWRPVEVPPELVEASDPRRPWIVQLLGVTDGGRIVLDLTLEGQRAVGDTPFWTFDPTNDEWTQLSDPGVTVDEACLAGGRIAVSSSLVDDNFVYSDVTLNVLTVDEGASDWTQGSPLQETRWAERPHLYCGEDFGVVYGNADVGPRAAFRQHLAAGEEWLPLEPIPDTVTPYGSASTGESLVLFGLEIRAVELAADGEGWRPLDLPPWRESVPPVWTGDAFVIIDPSAEDGVSIAEVGG